jgi:ectoine hydroxylase-related dioxygenase (phytanoyl-CoA dioxygenase family)
MGNGKNGMEKGVYRRGFTCFAVIYLADVPEPYSGNYTVWPGSHRFFEDYLNREGLEVLADGTPRVDLPEDPVMLTGHAGDLILAHHQIIHGPCPNASSNIRYATIARLRHVDCEENGNDGFTDIWREFPGVREVVEEETVAA